MTSPHQFHIDQSEDGREAKCLRTKPPGEAGK